MTEIKEKQDFSRRKRAQVCFLLLLHFEIQLADMDSDLEARANIPTYLFLMGLLVIIPLRLEPDRASVKLDLIFML